MLPKMNSRNVFIQNRFSIRALARVKGMTIEETSEYWAKENAVYNTADYIEWKALLKYYEKRKLLDKLFE